MVVQIKFNQPGKSDNKPKKEKTFTIKELFEIDKEIFKQIYQIEQDCFPEQIQSSEEELEEIFELEDSIKFIVSDKNGKIFSYLLAIPMVVEYEWLKNFDRQLLPDKESLYLESIAIKPNIKPEKILPDFLNTLFQRAKQKNFKKIVMHARVSNGFSEKMQKFYNGKYLRRLKNWHNFGEPFDYIEVDLEKIE